MSDDVSPPTPTEEPAAELLAAEQPAAGQLPTDPSGAEQRAAQQPADDGAQLDPAVAALQRVRSAGRNARPGGRRKARVVDAGSGYRDPVPLGDLVSQLAEARAWNAELNVGSVVGRWADIVGPEVAEHCVPETFEEGTLTLRTDSTAWAYQLRLLTPQLSRRLDEEIGRGVVERIVIAGPTAPSWIHGKRTVKGRGPRDTYG